MSGSEFDAPGSTKMQDHDLRDAEPDAPEVPSKNPARPPASAQILSSVIDRISGLNAELTELLSSLVQQINDSAEELNRLESAVENKKNELKELRGIEITADTIARLTAEQRALEQELEKLANDQRALWEEDKAEREREEKEYLLRLTSRRRSEEEEYRQMWESEKLKAQQKLEEDLQAIQHGTLQKQQEIEQDCLERELRLKQKELEWIELIQELEQFMRKLTRRTQTHAVALQEPTWESAPQPGLQESDPADSWDREPLPNEDVKRDRYFKDVWEVSAERQKNTPGDIESLFGSDNADESRPSIASLKEMLVSQGRRIESFNSEPHRKDSAPLKFQPKKTP